MQNFHYITFYSLPVLSPKKWTWTFLSGHRNTEKLIRMDNGRLQFTQL